MAFLFLQKGLGGGCTIFGLDTCEWLEGEPLWKSNLLISDTSRDGLDTSNHCSHLSLSSIRNALLC